MKKLLALCLLTCMAFPAHAEDKPENPPLSKILDSYALTNLTAAYYAHCGDKVKKLSDKQKINLATNHRSLQAILTIMLRGKNEDVKPESMLSFVRAAGVGMNTEVALNLPTTPCDDKKWGMYRKQLDVLADKVLVDNADKITKIPTAEEATQQLEAMVVPIKE